VHEHAGLCLQIADEHKVNACPSIARVGSQRNTAPLASFRCVLCVLLWGGCALHACPCVQVNPCVRRLRLHSPAAIPNPQDSRLSTLRRAKTRNKPGGAHIHTKKARRAQPPARERHGESGLSVCLVCVCRANYMILPFTVRFMWY